MYDLPQLQNANSALLTAIETLAREEGVPIDTAWITQLCGYPLQTSCRGQFTVLGIPCYSVPGCAGPTHRSFIVVAAASPATSIERLRGGSFAVNSVDSNTGMNLPRHVFSKVAHGKPFFNDVMITGSHRASMEAVAGGRADAAAVDCVTFGLHADYDPGTVAGLRILAQTSVSPAIPFVTSHRTGRRIVEALQRALSQFSSRAEFAPLRNALRLSRVEAPSAAAYDVLLEYEAEAVALGYPHLV